MTYGGERGKKYGYNPVVAVSLSPLDGLEEFAGQNPVSLKHQLLADGKLKPGLLAAVQSLHKRLDHGVDRLFRYDVYSRGSTAPEDKRNLSDMHFIDSLKTYLSQDIPPIPHPHQQLEM